MICHPDKNDISQIKEIWKTCFDDTDENINCYFSNCFSSEDCYIYKTGETVISCLQMIPCYISDKGKLYKAKYMYAVCTGPEFQGRGYMSQLISKACENEKTRGTKAVVCIPVNEKLFGFYKRFGFVNGVYCSTLNLSREDIKKCAKPCEYFLNADTKLFNSKRNDLLSDKCFVRFSDKYISLADGNYYSTVYNDNFYCIFSEEDNSVKVEDSFWVNQQGKNEMLYSLLKETNATGFEIYCCNTVNSCLKGVVKYLDKDISDIKSIYLGIKME